MLECYSSTSHSLLHSISFEKSPAASNQVSLTSCNTLVSNLSNALSCCFGIESNSSSVRSDTCRGLHRVITLTG